MGRGLGRGARVSPAPRPPARSRPPKVGHSFAALPVARSVLWVRHPPLEEGAAWDGPLPWPQPGAPPAAPAPPPPAPAPAPSASAASAACAAARSAGASLVPYVMVLLEAGALVEEVASCGWSLRPLVSRVALHHPGCALCVASVGLDRHLRAREMREGAARGPRGAAAAPPAAAPFSRAPVDAALVDALTHARGVRTREARDAAAAAEHVVLLTAALQQQPYKPEPTFLSLFAAERAKGAGVTRRHAAAAAGGGDGDDGDGGGGEAAGGSASRLDPSLSAAWVRSLALLPGCSAENAAAVAAAYPGPAALLRAYAGLSEAHGRALLKQLTNPASGAAKPRKVGPAFSGKLWSIMAGKVGPDEKAF